MGVIVISAVDNTTDTFTSVAHGLNTGDGAGAMFVGTGGVIPTGLAPVTDYWAIRVDADHFKLASSSANALANVPINITTNGTLPLSFLVGIPYRVPMIAAAGVQIKSANDNSTWQTLVALWNLLTGQSQSLLTGLNFTVDVGHGNKTLELGAFGQVNQISYDFTGTAIAASNAGGIAGSIIIPIPLKVGDRVQSVTFNRKGNAGAYSQVCSIQKMTNAGVFSTVQTAGAVTTPTGAVWTQQTVTIGSPVKIAAGESWYAVWSPNAVIQSLSGVDVVYDRPV